MPTAATQVHARWLPLSAPLGLGLLKNAFGDVSMVCRLAAFNALGRFSVVPGAGFTDWEFHARARLQGCKIGLVPDALVWYRKHAGERVSSAKNTRASYVRTTIPYMKSAPEYAALFSYTKSHYEADGYLYPILKPSLHGHIITFQCAINTDRRAGLHPHRFQLTSRRHGLALRLLGDIAAL